MKRLLSVLLIFVLLTSGFAGASGFSLDPDAINESAGSVVMLAVYDIANRLIGTGSGFVAFSENYVVTNYHVIDGADVIVAYTDWGDTLWINRVLCADSGRDIAVLVFEEESGLKPLALSQSGEIARGGAAVAIGSPIGFRNSVSIGNISSAAEDEYDGTISFTAPISSGSSGGALLNDDGEVIGVTSSTLGSASDVQNLNFAVSISYVRELYEAHKADEPVPFLDLETVDQKTEIQRPKDDALPAAREFTIKNYAGFSISEVYLYPDGAKSWGQARNKSGWLNNNSQMSFTVTDEEATQDTLWTLNFCFYYQKRPYYMDWDGIDLKRLLGRTLVIRMENGNAISLEIE
ncbi:MAG: serine protease [Clostridia bacterium]|nr:serine protease [Clostridia bacterium]